MSFSPANISLDDVIGEGAFNEINANFIGMAAALADVEAAVEDVAPAETTGTIYLEDFEWNGKKANFNFTTDTTIMVDNADVINHWIQACVGGQKLGMVAKPGRVCFNGRIEVLPGFVYDCKWPPPFWGYAGQPVFCFVAGGSWLPDLIAWSYRQPSLRGGSTNEEANYAYLRNFCLYGQNPTGVGPIAACNGFGTEGRVRGLQMTGRTLVRRFANRAYQFASHLQNRTFGLGFHLTGLSAESCGYIGFDIDGITDSVIEGRAHTCGNGYTYVDANGDTQTDDRAGGWYVRGLGDDVITAHATFCARGMVTGDSQLRTFGRPNGANVKINLRTDRSQYAGFDHRAHGTRNWFVIALLNRDQRDQRNATHAGASELPDQPTTDEYGPGGYVLDGGSGEPALGLDFLVLQNAGTDDSYPDGVDRDPYTSPPVGGTLGNCRYTRIWGTMHGKFHGHHYRSTLTPQQRANFWFDPGCRMKTGGVDSAIEGPAVPSAQYVLPQT